MTSPTERTPQSLGYRVPAEWAPHAATWLSWPHRQKTWPGRFEPIPGIWANLVRTLARFEPVHICAGGDEVMAEARALVGDVINVTLHNIRTDDAWARDHGPMFLVGGTEPALIDWGFNAWGRKYPAFVLDDQVPRRVAETLGYKRFEPGIVLEGGAVDFNGVGTAFTTEQCLLNPNRNPGLSRSDVEHYLADYCGTRHVIWLGEGMTGDDTDGHVDELARFVGPRTVVVAAVDDPADINYRALRDARERLESATDQDGLSLEVLPLPAPAPVIYNGQRLPASYCNFYVANGVVIVPQFDCPADRKAIEILSQAFPERQVLGLRAVELVLGLGAFHCITQQQPVWSA
jgi:agmatine deiminase